ncbi:uncharacterized protein METZ01_LOCUS175192 [marine metagenome]|uniref:Tryptophan synthase beta chain-like PALP domain-containing protein n=1 Tax=marine metagenome TaxID=408172 RepID=A0A382C8B1_9ZZZZ
MKNLDFFSAVGNTPLVELVHLSPKDGVRMFAKLEGNNPSGSIKDRVASYLIRSAENSGALIQGQTIVEASTGNMALALAAAAKQRGYQMRAVVPPQVAPGIPDLLVLFGVEILWMEPRLGMLGPIEEAQRLAKENGWWFAQQFANPANLMAHYETTGPEILMELDKVDVFVAGIGTGGTVTGVGRRLKERNSETLIVGVEPKFGERLQGLRSLEEGYIPPLLDMSLLDRRFIVDSPSAFAAVRRLVEMEGIFAGISSGAVLHAALRVAEGMESGNVVMTFADHGWKYMNAFPWMTQQKRPEGAPDDVAWW